MSIITVSPIPARVASNVTGILSKVSDLEGLNIDTFSSQQLNLSKDCSISLSWRQPFSCSSAVKVYHQCPSLRVEATTSSSPYVTKNITGYSNILSSVILDYSVKVHTTFVRWQMYTVDLADRVLEMSINLKNRP